MYRILVVDDNPTNLDLTSRILRKAGYGVDLAPDGEQGVRMAGEWRYDLIVMDMAMPGISGAEATKLIRTAEHTEGTRRVPVIAFTANAVEEFRQRAIRADMDDFIVKPIEKRQLLSAVDRSLDDRPVILVADDHLVDRERTMAWLRTLDHVCIVGAASGAAALAACTRQRVSFAVMNLSLPDISGIEAAHQIRHSKYGENIGIIAVSDRLDLEARKHSIASGYAGYLEKPFTQADLNKIIQPLISVI